MQIQSINNINFGAKINISKQKNVKVLEGVASSALGLGSLFIGLDSWCDSINLQATEKVVDVLYSAKEVETEDGELKRVYNDKMDSAMSFSSIYLIPCGSFMTTYGMERFIDANEKDDDSIPD